MGKVYLLLGVVAALLHGAGYITYSWQVLTGKSEPKAASWTVWAFLAILNAFSFSNMVTNWFTGLQFFVGTAGGIGTLLIALRYGKLLWPKGSEWNYMLAGLVASVVWKVFQSAEWANMIVLSAVLISFKPTLAAVWKGPFVDKVLAWQLWTSAFGVTIANLALQNERLVVYVMPVAMLIAHGTIAWLSRESRRQKFLI